MFQTAIFKHKRFMRTLTFYLSEKDPTNPPSGTLLLSNRSLADKIIISIFLDVSKEN